ncbi:hypothetical protein [Streptosporangium pseudovulgare]|nr:hypothetical protein [Streptosporangium pseudovulgare]
MIDREVGVDPDAVVAAAAGFSPGADMVSTLAATIISGTAMAAPRNPMSFSSSAIQIAVPKGTVARL